MRLSKEIANWIKGQVEKADKKGIVFGLSGGVDSALIAHLAKMAVGDKLELIKPSGNEDIILGEMQDMKGNAMDEAKGGGYKGGEGKKQKSLKKWGKEDWQTREEYESKGKKAARAAKKHKDKK